MPDPRITLRQVLKLRWTGIPEARPGHDLSGKQAFRIGWVSYKIHHQPWKWWRERKEAKCERVGHAWKKPALVDTPERFLAWCQRCGLASFDRSEVGTK